MTECTMGMIKWVCVLKTPSPHLPQKYKSLIVTTASTYQQYFSLAMGKKRMSEDEEEEEKWGERGLEGAKGVKIGKLLKF